MKQFLKKNCCSVIKLLADRERGFFKGAPHLSFLKIAEEKAATSEMQETHCQIPSSVRSTFLMSFSFDCSKVASTHGDHKIYVCSVRTGKLLHTLQCHPRTPWCLEFHPTSNDIVASGCLGGEVRVWQLHGGSEIWIAPNSSVITSLTFHPFDKFLVIATQNELHFWNWIEPVPFAVCKTKCNREKVRFVKFNSLGNKLITGISNVNSSTRESTWSPSTSSPPHPIHNFSRDNRSANTISRNRAVRFCSKTQSTLSSSSVPQSLSMMSPSTLQSTEAATAQLDSLDQSSAMKSSLAAGAFKTQVSDQSTTEHSSASVSSPFQASVSATRSSILQSSASATRSSAFQSSGLATRSSALQSSGSETQPSAFQLSSATQSSTVLAFPSSSTTRSLTLLTPVTQSSSTLTSSPRLADSKVPSPHMNDLSFTTNRTTILKRIMNIYRRLEERDVHCPGHQILSSVDSQQSASEATASGSKFSQLRSTELMEAMLMRDSELNHNTLSASVQSQPSSSIKIRKIVDNSDCRNTSSEDSGGNDAHSLYRLRMLCRSLLDITNAYQCHLKSDGVPEQRTAISSSEVQALRCVSSGDARNHSEPASTMHFLHGVLSRLLDCLKASTTGPREQISQILRKLTQLFRCLSSFCGCRPKLNSLTWRRFKGSSVFGQQESSCLSHCIRLTEAILDLARESDGGRRLSCPSSATFTPTLPGRRRILMCARRLPSASRNRLHSPPLLTLLQGARELSSVGPREEAHGFTHRIQLWDFSNGDLPDLKKANHNIVVKRCKIHNDASVDISRDGSLLVAFVPYSSSGVERLVFGVYSLKSESLGRCLCTWGFDSNAISVSLSPLGQYVVVGLPSPPPSSPEKEAVAQIFRLKPIGSYYGAVHIRSLTQLINNEHRYPPVSLNSVQWLPQPGQGLIYGTNRGCLCICKPK